MSIKHMSKIIILSLTLMLGVKECLAEISSEKYYYEMLGTDVISIRDTLKNMEDSIRKNFKSNEVPQILDETYAAITIDIEANFKRNFRLLDIYETMMKEYNISKQDAISMFQKKDPRFYKIFDKKRKELILQSIFRVIQNMGYLKVEKVWSDINKESNIKLIELLKRMSLNYAQDVGQLKSK